MKKVGLLCSALDIAVATCVGLAFVVVGATVEATLAAIRPLQLAGTGRLYSTRLVTGKPQSPVVQAILTGT